MTRAAFLRWLLALIQSAVLVEPELVSVAQLPATAWPNPEAIEVVVGGHRFWISVDEREGD